MSSELPVPCPPSPNRPTGSVGATAAASLVGPGPAAVLYAPGTTKSQTLLAFATDLAARGWRVHGVVIDTLWDARLDGGSHPTGPGGGGCKIGLDLIDLATRRRLPLARPNRNGLAVGRWVLDPGVLAAADRLLHNAAAAVGSATGPDLIVVDKFGPLEGRGEGFSAGLTAAVRSGGATLVSVRGAFLGAWDGFVATALADSDGTLGPLLRPRLADLWRWWGPLHLAEELRRSIPAEPVKRVVIGRNWTLVEGPDGAGLAHAPARDAPGCRPLAEAGSHTERSLADLAQLTASWNPAETAIGWAAVNAHVNAPARLAGLPRISPRDGLEALVAATDGDMTRTGRPGVIVGRFPARRMAALEAAGTPVQIVEKQPRAEEWPEVATPHLVAAAGRVLLTASSLGNHSLPALLSACFTGRPRPVTALVGPGTPMLPALHAYGLDILSGFVIDAPDRAARVVAEGGGGGDLAACGRKLTLTATPTGTDADD